MSNNNDKKSQVYDGWGDPPGTIKKKPVTNRNVVLAVDEPPKQHQQAFFQGVGRTTMSNAPLLNFEQQSEVVY